MRKKIKKIFKRLGNRHNITAVGTILAIGGISMAMALVAASFSRARGDQIKAKNRQSAYADELKKLSGITTNLEQVPDETASWQVYDSQKYNFSIKYPPDWQTPKETSPDSESKYLLKISFNSQANSKGESRNGFDVFIYSSSKFTNYLGTDNLVQKSGNIEQQDCPHFDDITLGESGYPAKEINVTAEDPCWEETFFYSLTKNGFTYNIVPRSGNKYDIKNFDEKISLVKILPQFYDIVSTLNFTEKESVAQTSKRVVQKAVSPPKARYTAGAKCNHKNDHPRKSKTKGKHIDEDCCPDPDEWPNPRCAYSSGGLGLMRSGPKK
ncbi:MAG: hypothetical protein Q8L09_05420 [Candidatus Moranbacteria bacterium]|nr:hypothetical protein [Candidatus Moranbacteria bacterium]